MGHAALATTTAFILCHLTGVHAQYCAKLTDPARKARVDSVMQTFVEDSCCHTTLAKCLNERKPCPIALQLANFACFLGILDRDHNTIRDELKTRHAFMHETKTVTLDPGMFPAAGNPDAPVSIVAYVNATCPLCKRVTVPLYQAVTSGPLRGRARLYVLPFSPITANAGYVAANRLGRFWEFFLALAEARGRINDDVLVTTAEYLGMPGGKFKPLLFDKNVESTLEKNYARAKRIGVSSTPTVFINGKRYTSHKDPEWIADAVLYELERLGRGAGK
ncbi:MAG: thioredoxin domain-containing protein [Chitinivibrionales bacterium]|nr:thioredoxin domain-containing protein [Chitinivibrionales bacterium]MBD3396311.1 thioredoxin domain-containing protein [Chitinivibrionales bacterium]